jgi:N-acyl-D-amino-acid deacylase
MAWSVLVRGASVVDGSGAPARAADVALEGERIAAVAPRLDGEAARVIDAGGHVVAPGFIDMHSHSDLFYFGCPSAESKVRQGVTTEVVGMCSFSQAPLRTTSCAAGQVASAPASTFAGGPSRSISTRCGRSGRP